MEKASLRTGRQSGRQFPCNREKALFFLGFSIRSYGFFLDISFPRCECIASCIFSCYRKTTIGIRQTIYLVDRHDRKSDSWRKRVQRIHVQPILRRLLSHCRNGIGYRFYMANHLLLPLFSHRCMCHSRMAEKKIIRPNHIIGIFKLTLNSGQRFKVRIIFLCHDF